MKSTGKLEIFFIVLCIGILVVVMWLNNCYKGFTLENNKEEISGETTSISELPNEYVYEYIDAQTGVHYLVYSRKSGNAGMGGMTPRLNADGTIMVTEIKKE